MHKILLVVFLSSIPLIYGGSYGSTYSSSSSSCQRFENRIYLLTVTFPDLKPLNAAMRFQSYGAFDEIFSVGDGNNGEQVGANFSLSHRFGFYKCLSKNIVRATGLGFLYKTLDVPFLKDNGATVIHDYYFTFSNNDQSLTGRVKFAVFTNGKNPFTTSDSPVFQGPVGQVKGELLRFRKYFDLSKP